MNNHLEVSESTLRRTSWKSFAIQELWINAGRRACVIPCPASWPCRPGPTSPASPRGGALSSLATPSVASSAICLASPDSTRPTKRRTAACSARSTRRSSRNWSASGFRPAWAGEVSSTSRSTASRRGDRDGRTCRRSTCWRPTPRKWGPSGTNCGSVPRPMSTRMLGNGSASCH